MDSQLLISGAVTIGVGAISGGITNAVAIWMLFHPYEKKFGLHGAIPKNKERLAKSIGKTVGERLLTPEDLTARLAAPQVQEAFAGAIGGVINNLLDKERGPLREELGPDLIGTIEGALTGVAPSVAERVGKWAESEDFDRLLNNFLDGVTRQVGDQPIGDTLSEGHRERIGSKVREWVSHLAEQDDLEATLRHWVHERLDRMAHDQTPLLDRLPEGLVGTVESAITDYLPIALERLSALLADPAARDRVERALRDAFDHSVRDLLLHERILAKLVVTDRTIERLVDGFEAEGFDRFAAALAEPGMKAQVTRAVNDAVVNFLRLPLAERLARLTPEKRGALEITLGDWLVRVVRDDATRDAVARAADRLLGVVERRTWGEALNLVPRERAVGLARDVITGERGQRWISDSVSQVIERLLSRPIGRPARWLSDDTAHKVRDGITHAAWGWIQGEIPRIVQQLNVQEMVEQKVRGFSTQRMEEIVRNVTQKELTLIVQLGYVLGAIVGAVAFGVNVLLR
ncbi:MAG TPA: DUF445 family protein [Gemmatimonadales bacterium]|nr:DUF445 family protein [Gemmatimonadales bacterium]